jgi:hypothetical protein
LGPQQSADQILWEFFVTFVVEKNSVAFLNRPILKVKDKAFPLQVMKTTADLSSLRPGRILLLRKNLRNKD